MTVEYQVLARKYRPQTFKDVLGQDHIVQTLKNAIKNKRLAHAYLFCGSRGTGKTTLARVFAKALNCQHPSAEGEPCNTCSSCREITNGHSLDVLEIDGASHRGIDDIRQINETVGYSAASGKFKIYIIDEVHMLTKEAFNALLKTLEEPPPKVMFFFATTEPHKVLPTILSRCQRFNLNRIPLSHIVSKLTFICKEQNVVIEENAIRMLAQRAEGGLRDAESLLDQIIAFQAGDITEKSVADILGVVSKDVFFEIDRAAKESFLGKAFEVAEQIFAQGKDLNHFLEGLTTHFRTLILVKIAEKNSSLLDLLPGEYARYEASALLYSQEQMMTILELLTEALQHMRSSPSPRISLETVLLKVLRIHQRLPVEVLVRRLAELEKAIQAQPGSGSSPKESSPAVKQQHPTNSQVHESSVILETKKKQEIEPLAIPRPEAPRSFPSSLVEDPTPTASDLGKKTIQAPPSKLFEPKLSNQEKVPAAPTPPKETQQAPTKTAPSSIGSEKKNQSHYDTLLQFAAVELEGTVQKKSQFGQK